MEKKLRKKFVLISMGSVIVILGIIIGFANISNYYQIIEKTEVKLNTLIENDGMFPISEMHKPKEDPMDSMSPEEPYSTRYFVIKVNEDEEVTYIDTRNIFRITDSAAVEYYEEIYDIGKSSGKIDGYRYKVINTDYGKLAVFVDVSMDMEIFYSFLVSSIAVCLIGLMGLLLLLIVLSKRAISPIAQSYSKQKRFITDVSHELKTPLAIINTNTDVIEMDYGESNWTKNIHGQVERLNELVLNLVSLTKLDEEDSVVKKELFDISDLAKEAVISFETLFATCDKKLITEIDEGIVVFGNAAELRNLVHILLDNCCKYADKSMPVKFGLKQHGKQIELYTENMADNITKGNNNFLFDRFYRNDISRSSEVKGYGIGLSIAEAIVKKHKGSISAYSRDGKNITIKIIL